jgi:hypothetical protein
LTLPNWKKETLLSTAKRLPFQELIKANGPIFESPRVEIINRPNPSQ